eukprot:scaffold207_cov267-Pinguiococcus_pyrenoidosus.AAC.21
MVLRSGEGWRSSTDPRGRRFWSRRPPAPGLYGRTSAPPPFGGRNRHQSPFVHLFHAWCVSERGMAKHRESEEQCIEEACRRLAEQGSDRKEELGDAAGTCHLLYSAREPEEFAFRAEIEEGAAAWPKNLSVSFRATHVGQEGRLEAEDVEKAVDALRGRDGSVIAFVCGPPAFTDTMEGYALMAGADDVRLERWW